MNGDEDDELKTPLTVKTKRDKTDIKTSGYKLDLGTGFKKRVQ